MLGVLADPGQQCGLAFPQPGQAEEVKASHVGDATVMPRPSMSGVREDWRPDPGEILLVSGRPDDAGDLGLAQVQAGRRLRRNFRSAAAPRQVCWKVEPLARDMVVHSLHERVEPGLRAR